VFPYLAFAIPLFFAVLLPLLLGLLFLMPPALRPKGRKIVWASLGSAAGICAYQIAYVPIMIVGFVVTMPIWCFFSDPWRGYIGIIVAMGWLFGFCFAMLLCGYISGWQIGRKFSEGTPLKESVRLDPLFKLVSRLRFRKAPIRDADILPPN
jgi:hypothetical protein